MVGGGAAGLAVAQALRAEGFAGPLTLACGEPGLPDDRPPLSKQVLCLRAAAWVFAAGDVASWVSRRYRRQLLP